MTGKVRSIENFETAAAPPRGRGAPFFTSPRTVQACMEEGIDPDIELAVRELKDFLLCSKGDAEVAQVRLDHANRRRADVIALLKRRRDRIAAAAPAPASAEPTVQRRAATPVAASSAELTGTTPVAADAAEAPGGSAPSAPSASAPGGSDGHSDDDDDGQNSSTRIDTGNASERRELVSPEDYMRERARGKKLRLHKQVERMRLAIEANAAYEAQKAAIAQQQRERLEAAEKAAEARREKEAWERNVKRTERRRREAEQLVERERKEAALRAKHGELHAQRLAKIEEAERRDQIRAAKAEEHRLGQELLFAERRLVVKERAATIDEAQDSLQRERQRDLTERTAHADETRERLQRKRDAALAEARLAAENARREHQEARARAAAAQSDRVKGYEERAAAAEAARIADAQERNNYLLARRLAEAERAREREAVVARVKSEEAAKAKALAEKLAAEEAHMSEVQAAAAHAARMRAAAKDLVVQDRMAAVGRMRRVVVHELSEQEARNEAKMARIAAMRSEQAAMDEQRKRIARNLFLVKRAQGPLAAGPGPLDYAATDAWAFTVGPGRGVRIGRPTAAFKPDRDLAPGPGAYGAPLLPRRIRGGVMPRKETDVEEIRRKLERSRQRAQRMMSADPLLGETGHSSSEGSPPRSKSAALPSIGAAEHSKHRHQGRSRRMRASMDRPAELQDEDFNSSDDFESVDGD